MENSRLKTILSYTISILIYGGLFGFLVLRIINADQAGLYNGTLNKPGFFPNQTNFEAFSLVALISIGISNAMIIINKIQINRRKNVFINSLIVAGMIFSWYFLLIKSSNLVGALVMVIAEFLVSLIVISMLWLVEHKAGYYFIPSLLWSVARIILSISLVVLN